MSVGVGLCRNVGRSDVFVFEFSVLALFEYSLFLHELTSSLFLHKTTLTSTSQNHTHFLQQTQQGTDLGFGGAIGVM